MGGYGTWIVCDVDLCTGLEQQAHGPGVAAGNSITLEYYDDNAVTDVNYTNNIQVTYRVTGTETYLIRVVVPVVHDLERVLRPMWRFGETNTGAVMSAPIEGRPITREMAERAFESLPSPP